MAEVASVDTSPEMHAAEIAGVREYILGNHDLPIAKHRAEIEDAIRGNSVILLLGKTGSGKTTQVAQYALEMTDDMGYPEFDKIEVTQPRIMAARTVSERVAEEIAAADQAHRVGYYTSKEGTNEPQRTQDIAFLTDGKAAVQLLHQGKHASPKTKRLLVIDEVHEWNVNIEQLIAIATEKTDPRSEQYDENLTVVIMSATMDTASLQKHFGHINPPIIEVQVPAHKVTHSRVNKTVAQVALELAAESEEKVLAFYPGKAEINNAAVEVAKMQSDVAPPKAVPVIPLHGQQTPEQQREAFKDYPYGAVVATTNAAETSLTVPGAIAVADSGLMRAAKILYDKVTAGSEGLFIEDASQANLMQRAGRVGRTRPGRYVLCSPDGKKPPVPLEYRQEYQTPAIETTRLDGLLLHLKATGYEIDDFRFFHKPPEKAVAAARNRLFVLGAVDIDGNITERGRLMEGLPLEPEYSCMIAFAHEKGYSDEVKAHMLDIAAIMQRGGIIKRSPKEKAWQSLLDRKENGEIKEEDSDFFAQLEVYVRLAYHIDQEERAQYDVNEYTLGLVEEGRQSLAGVLGMTIYDAEIVAPENRQAVLTCIHAGQLNQLWERDGVGEGLRLAMERSQAYDIAESSVVSVLGEFATGTLFTLGLGHRDIDRVQDVNNVLSVQALEDAAAHLITEVVDHKTVKYDLEQQQLLVRVERRIGNMVLRIFSRPVEVRPGSPEVELIRSSHREQAWDVWEKEHKINRKAKPKLHTLETIDGAIETPESEQYGTDPITNQPLLAYKGGKGQWCRTREIAIDSLKSHKERLEKAPRIGEQRALKAAVQETQGDLIALKNRRGSTRQETAAVKDLLAKKKRMDKKEWLAQARELLNAA